MSRELLIESHAFNVRDTRILEGDRDNSNDGQFVVTGLLQRVGEINKNKRIYPKPILEREVKRYVDEELSENRGWGELDHPESSVVNLKNTSHRVIDVRWEGNELYGDILVLDTPAGRILKELFKSGGDLGISSRGLGSVSEDKSKGALIVQEDYKLIAWDFVSEPSTQGAYMEVNEGVSHNGSRTFDSEIHGVIRDIICDLSGVCEV